METETRRFQFPATYRIGVRPVPDTVLAFVAPRPLEGTPTDLGLGGWVGQVIVDPTAERAAWCLERNRALDARLVGWVPEDVALAAERARLTREYGADALDGIDDRVLLESFVERHRGEVLDVEVPA